MTWLRSSLDGVFDNGTWIIACNGVRSLEFLCFMLAFELITRHWDGLRFLVCFLFFCMWLWVVIVSHPAGKSVESVEIYFKITVPSRTARKTPNISGAIPYRRRPIFSSRSVFEKSQLLWQSLDISEVDDCSDNVSCFEWGVNALIVNTNTTIILRRRMNTTDVLSI